MRIIERRIRNLERVIPRRASPERAWEEIEQAAVTHLCVEHLLILRAAVREHEAGVVRELTTEEMEAVTAYNRALKMEWRRA